MKPMNLSISLQREKVTSLQTWSKGLEIEYIVLYMTTILAVVATVYFYFQGNIIAYNDSESHLNIAKRVVDGLTPGLAHLGGIWLPLPHLLLTPFVKFDFLWRTGLAGSIVSGISFVISALFLHKLTYLITKNTLAGLAAVLFFVSNPNILYMQSTPMTEVPLIMFFVLSSYFFIKYIQEKENILSLLLAGFFGFLATLTRYDGWSLVVMEAGILVLMYLVYAIDFKALSKFNIKKILRRDKVGLLWNKLQGRVILFSTLAFFGIFLWLLWDFLILGDPLYFTDSIYSAKSQQEHWFAQGALPTYHNLPLSFIYYLVTSIANIGIIPSVIAMFGFAVFLLAKREVSRLYIALILLVPFIFYVMSLFLGQGIIFIPSVTPDTLQWNLFNVRYGTLMVPFAAIFAAYLFYKSKMIGKLLIGGLVISQLGLFGIGYTKVVTLEDGIRGVSSFPQEVPAQSWIRENYDYGMVLLDDYSRTLSILRTPIRMEDIIYIGTRPYWEESLEEPEKYARWIIIQEGDQVWHEMLGNPAKKDRLYQYFDRVYTSPEILIFKRVEANL